MVLPGSAGFGKATYAGRMPFNDYPNYLGLLVLGLAAAAWWSPHRRFVLALAVIALLGLLLAMGRFSPDRRIQRDIFFMLESYPFNFF